MNYDKIILNLVSRVTTLEQEVRYLKEQIANKKAYPHSNVNKLLPLKVEFENWLQKNNYKPTVVMQYSNAVNSVIKNEGLIFWDDLADNINLYVMQYDIGGVKEKFGNKGHRTVINALKRYKEFLDKL